MTAPTFVVRCAHGVLCRRTTCRTTAELVAAYLDTRAEAGVGSRDCAPYVITTEETARS